MRTTGGGDGLQAGGLSGWIHSQTGLREGNSGEFRLAPVCDLYRSALRATQLQQRSRDFTQPCCCNTAVVVM